MISEKISPEKNSCAKNSCAKSIDPIVHAAWSRMCLAMSPETFVLAWTDWAMHMATSPGKQIDLACMAMMNLTRMGVYLQECANAAAAPEAAGSISPPIRDRRFRAPEWNHWPFNLMHQNFLMTEEWWEQAARDVWGVNKRNEDTVAFSAREILGFFSPTNTFLTNPVVLKTTFDEAGANLSRGAFNMIDEAAREFGKLPPAGTENYAVGKNLAITPGKVVMRNELCELIQYSPTTGKVRPEPVFIVPAWIMKYYILDLSPENSMIRYLVDQGFTVFCISWKNPGVAEARMSMDDYLNKGVYDSLDAINSIMPKRSINAVGYCLGGTLLSIAMAAMARDGDDRVGSLTLLAAQTDFSEPGELSLFTGVSQLGQLEAMMNETGYLDSTQMAGAFRMLRSYDLVWSHIVDSFMLGKPPYINDLMAWNADATRMPAKMQGEYLCSMYLNDDLSEGRYRANGRAVSLGDISVPIFTVGTARDHVAPWKSVYKIHYLVPAEVTFVLTSGGHNAGIVSEPGHAGRNYQMRTRKDTDVYIAPDEWVQKAPKQDGSWWEPWVQWLAKRCGAPVAPPKMGSARYRPICDAPGQYVLEK